MNFKTVAIVVVLVIILMSQESHEKGGRRRGGKSGGKPRPPPKQEPEVTEIKETGKGGKWDKAKEMGEDAAKVAGAGAIIAGMQKAADKLFDKDAERSESHTHNTQHHHHNNGGYTITVFVVL
jgi:hypothetical protein